MAFQMFAYYRRNLALAQLFYGFARALLFAAPDVDREVHVLLVGLLGLLAEVYDFVGVQNLVDCYLVDYLSGSSLDDDWNPDDHAVDCVGLRQSDYLCWTNVRLDCRDA